MTVPRFELSNLDAVEWLRTLPSKSIDLVITDPAYESLEKHRAVGTTTRLKHSKSSSNDWFEIFPNARFGELFQEVFRVLKRNTLCIVKTAPPTKSRTYAPLEFRAEDGETPPLCSTLLSSSSHLASVSFGRCVGAAPT